MPRLRWLCVAATVAVMLPAFVAVRADAQPASAGLCWQSLAPDTGEQDDFEPPESTLTSTPSGEVWISRTIGPNLLRGNRGSWSLPPAVTREGVDELWVEAVAASPSGRIFIAAAANREDGALVLHIARLNNGGWEWLGAPLVSTHAPYTHAKRPSIAFVGEEPVVAWAESYGMPIGLFVARWNGSSWTQLGALPLGSPTDHGPLTPVVRVDARQQIWLAWSLYGGGLWIRRWDGSAWREVAGETLAKIVEAQGPTNSLDLSLAFDTKGRAWVLRTALQPHGPGLALARWDGTAWTSVSPPVALLGKAWTTRSASMILHRDAPVVAWAQADATDNQHLYVSMWESDDRWVSQLSNLHLVEGVSHVSDVHLTPGDGRGVIVSWDEPGKDKLNTRMVQAYACATAETPALSPPSIVERDTWPTTVDEAARRIVARFDDRSKDLVRTTARDELMQFYSGWGRGIRNDFGLWRGNEKLLASCGGGAKMDPEACSMVIIEAVWTLLQAPSPGAQAR